MKTSRIAVFHSKDQPLTCETVTVPALREGEILVRNEYTTLCRSDLTTFTGKRVEKTPTILGHEIVGRIEDLGPGAPDVDCRGTPLRVGDRVTWAIYASDPECALSRKGIPQKGTGLFKYGHERLTPENTLHGGLSEYCILRKNTPVIRLDLSIPLPVTALINCSVATVAGSLRVAGDLEGQNVVIAGAGMLGVIACAMARSMSARNVVAADIAESRLATACTFGANLTVKIESQGPSLKEEVARLMRGEPVQVVLDYSGIPETMEALLALLGIGGTAVWIGATFPQRPLQVNAELLIRNVHTMKGLHNYNQADLIAAVEFMEKHHAIYPFASLVHDRFDLEEVNDAFEYAIKSGVHRVGVRPNRRGAGQPPQ
jgi:putative phosphonate catabolism associated alcohol dehydrogenase